MYTGRQLQDLNNGVEKPLPHRLGRPWRNVPSTAPSESELRSFPFGTAPPTGRWRRISSICSGQVRGGGRGAPGPNGVHVFELSRFALAARRRGVDQCYEGLTMTTTHAKRTNTGRAADVGAGALHSSSKPPRPIPRWNRLGASYTLGKTERRRRQAESGAEAKSSGRREKNVALAEIGRRAKSVLIPVSVAVGGLSASAAGARST